MWFVKVFLAVFLLSSAIEAVVFNCNFGSNSCTLSSGAIASKADTTVTAVTGAYPAGVTSGSITAIDSRSIAIRYFPRGITKYFPNINTIYFEASLREIHKEDLQQFSTKLIRVYMSYNAIEILEKDLFVYNPNIQYLFLGNNNIKYVDSAVFDNLNNLLSLAFDFNYCYSGKVENNRNGVLDLIGQLKYFCTIGGDENTRTILDLQGKISSISAQNARLANNCTGVSGGSSSGSGGSGTGSGTSVVRIF